MPGWILDVAPKKVISSSQYGNAIRDRVVHQFNSVAERDATAVPKIGMFAYCYVERTLYQFLEPPLFYNPSAPPLGPLWCVYDTGWVPWPAQIFSGPTTTWSTDTMRAGYRRTLGSTEIFVQAIGTHITPTLDNDLICILVPVPTADSTESSPAVAGSFGTAQIQDPVAGTLGPLGMFDATQLAVGLLHSEGTGVADKKNLVVRGDLSDAAGATFNLYMSGSYPSLLQ